ncbi:glycosyltransferase family 2 protein [Weissella confusa]|uniref:glycosyltransferase family 2 protein n=1 Tax=Weissella confusa TaxID=1583 RepID=UPI0022DEED77|nr:glycosyltransferase [Weissella confusa]
MNGQELISVVMPTLNESVEQLNVSISSILNQSYQKFEFIIVDDGNKNLASVLKNISDSRVRVVINNKPGLVNALNLAVGEAKGNWIARMDADDVSLSTRLNDTYDFAIRNNLDLVGTAMYLIDYNGVRIGELRYNAEVLNQKKIAEVLSEVDILPHPTWIVRKKVFEKIGGYKNYYKSEDYAFLLSAIEVGTKLGYMDVPTLEYRTGLGRTTTSAGVYQTYFNIRKMQKSYKMKSMIKQDPQVIKVEFDEISNFAKRSREGIMQAIILRYNGEPYLNVQLIIFVVSQLLSGWVFDYLIYLFKQKSILRKLTRKD